MEVNTIPYLHFPYCNNEKIRKNKSEDLIHQSLFIYTFH